ncbi:hypothetical protein GALMADRAFT_915818 [Galerina marginata CBS 339.88]|uniref:Uncharacterized protein n=1 Tax=Galerina marginata (strain CBS 339.88) TaxID=685588 RepID=A0A067SF46_GALM3|nr:hypothetical protein GALMADRAFT_915818 [Galerina marginata CBS 339.88]
MEGGFCLRVVYNVIIVTLSTIALRSCTGRRRVDLRISLSAWDLTFLGGWRASHRVSIKLRKRSLCSPYSRQVSLYHTNVKWSISRRTTGCAVFPLLAF